MIHRSFTFSLATVAVLALALALPAQARPHNRSHHGRSYHHGNRGYVKHGRAYHAPRYVKRHHYRPHRVIRPVCVPRRTVVVHSPVVVRHRPVSRVIHHRDVGGVNLRYSNYGGDSSFGIRIGTPRGEWISGYVDSYGNYHAGYYR